MHNYKTWSIDGFKAKLWLAGNDMSVFFVRSFDKRKSDS